MASQYAMERSDIVEAEGFHHRLILLATITEPSENQTMELNYECVCGRKHADYGVDLSEDVNPFFSMFTNGICSCGRYLPTQHNLVSVPDFKLQELDFPENYRSMTVPEPLVQPHRAFVKNVDRVLAVEFFPNWLMNTADEFRRLAIFAAIEVTGDPKTDSSKVSQIQERFETLLSSRDPIHVVSGRTDLRSWIQENQLINVESLQQLLNWRATEGARLSVESMLSSMVIGAWTAFETLSGDLWEAAVNARPKLAFEALRADAKPATDTSKAHEKKRNMFPIHPDRLEDPSFEPLKMMGTLLKENEKWVFWKREHVFDAYEQTFPKMKAEFAKILSAQELRWLSKLRSTLVHEAGKVDRDFTRVFREHPSLSSLQTNDYVQLDGSVVAPLVRTAISKGKLLIEAVTKAL